MDDYILVVEDNTDSQAFVAENLRATYNCQVVSNAADGLAAIKQQRPLLIVLDLMLPGSMDGWGFMQQVVSTYGKSIPIYVISAWLLTADLKNRALKAGATLARPKPVEPSVLTKDVSNMLARQ